MSKDPLTVIGWRVRRTGGPVSAAVIVIAVLAVVSSCPVSMASGLYISHNARSSYARSVRSLQEADSLTVLTSALAVSDQRERETAAVAAPGDRSATVKLLEAAYRLTKAVLARVRAVDNAAAVSAEVLGHECRGVLRGAPSEGQVIGAEWPPSKPRLSGRVQGEQERSKQQMQTTDREIDEMLSVAANRVLRGPYEAYAAAVDRLTWSDPTVDRLVHQRTARLREEFARPPVEACADMRAWAASGFHVLSPESKSLEEAREARNERAVRDNLGALLRPYEGRAGRAIVRRIKALKVPPKQERRGRERLAHAEYHMKLALGEKVPRLALRQFAPVIGKGRTHAGTTFVIRARPGKEPGSSCRHEVEIEISKGRVGVINGVCLSEGGHSRPSSSCSGSVETIELATPSGVRRARIRLSDGRTVMVSVVRVPAKDGGPAGVLVDAFQGRNRYPVSAQELGRNGRVLRTVRLGKIRCTGESVSEGPGPPRFIHLATAIAPSGEPLNIEGTLLRFRGKTEFSVGPLPGMRNSKSNEESGGPKRQFEWSLSTECAPHPYSLIAGVLAPPGSSVLVRTPAGLAPLTKVELAASMHAEGPLFYGAYATPPTEIVVERSDGSMLYTESLAAKATEETEFCEGYAER